MDILYDIIEDVMELGNTFSITNKLRNKLEAILDERVPNIEHMGFNNWDFEEEDDDRIAYCFDVNGVFDQTGTPYLVIFIDVKNDKIDVILEFD